MTIQEAGWYWAEGDPQGTKRYWTGEAWAPGIVGLEPWRRMGAKLIDIAIMVVFSLLLVLIFGSNAGNTYLLTLLTLVVAVFYEVGFVTTKGGTPGKLILGLPFYGKICSPAHDTPHKFSRVVPRHGGPHAAI